MNAVKMVCNLSLSRFFTLLTFLPLLPSLPLLSLGPLLLSLPFSLFPSPLSLSKYIRKG